MVAIKAAHIKLSIRDLWPDLPWEWGDEIRIREVLREDLISQGIKEHRRLHFAEAKAWEQYLQQFPRYAERQNILKKIYPVQVTSNKPSLFTHEEVEYLLQRLEGVNDPTGQDIVEKLRRDKYGLRQ